MDVKTTIPFVLLKKVPIAGRGGFREGCDYHPVRQLWIKAEHGEPLVSLRLESSRLEEQQSQFGETIMTKTHEGVDQVEGGHASEFGETALTESGEGADSPETINSSNFGETVFTATSEGADQSESVVEDQRAARI